MEELSNRGVVVPVVRIGWPDVFVDHGKPDALREKHGISVQATVAKALPLPCKRPRASRPAPWWPNARLPQSGAGQDRRTQASMPRPRGQGIAGRAVPGPPRARFGRHFP